MAITAKFTELKKCPNCGSSEGVYIKVRYEGSSNWYMNFDGQESNNTEFHGSFEVKEGKRAYCKSCDKFVGIAHN